MSARATPGRGNRKAGQGTWRSPSSTPEQIGVELAFLKPFKATNDVTFSLAPAGDGTEVTWPMTGEQHGLWPRSFGKVVSMDKLVGKDFEKGLTRLKADAETQADRRCSRTLVIRTSDPTDPRQPRLEA